MKLLVPIAVALVAFLSCSVAEGFHRFPFPFPPPGRPSRGFMFPECRPFMKAVEERKRENDRNGEGGPWSCRRRGLEHAECRFADMLKARNEISREPSEECLNQVIEFFEGSNNQTSTTFEETTITTVETTTLSG